MEVIYRKEDYAAAVRELQISVHGNSAGIKSADLAREIGVSSVTIRRAWLAGELPGLAHGPRCVVIPHRIARLVRQFGLHRVRLMIRTGK